MHVQYCRGTLCSQFWHRLSRHRTKPPPIPFLFPAFPSTVDVGAPKQKHAHTAAPDVPQCGLHGTGAEDHTGTSGPGRWVMYAPPKDYAEAGGGLGDVVNADDPRCRPDSPLRHVLFCSVDCPPLKRFRKCFARGFLIGKTRARMQPTGACPAASRFLREHGCSSWSARGSLVGKTRACDAAQKCSEGFPRMQMFEGRSPSAFSVPVAGPWLTFIRTWPTLNTIP